MGLINLHPLDGLGCTVGLRDSWQGAQGTTGGWWAECIRKGHWSLVVSCTDRAAVVQKCLYPRLLCPAQGSLQRPPHVTGWDKHGFFSGDQVTIHKQQVCPGRKELKARLIPIVHMVT